MAFLRANFLGGLITANITDSATSWTMAGWADLPEVIAPDKLKLTLDTAIGIARVPEVIYVGAHTAGSTTITSLERGMEQDDDGGPARAHLAITGESWRLSATVKDWTILKDNKVKALEYIAADGSTDDTTNWGYLAADAAGKTIVGLGGRSSKVTGVGVVLDENTTIEGDETAIFNTTAPATVLTIASGCHLDGVEVYGTGAATYNDSGRLVKVVGTVGDYATDWLLSNCHLHDAAGYAFFAEFAGGHIESSLIEKFGYAGVMARSIDGFFVDGCIVDGDDPVGTAGNAYGIEFNRTTGGDLSVYPLSTNFGVSNTLVKDIPLWHGIGTHGGRHGKIQAIIENCNRGLAIVSALDSVNYAPKDITFDVSVDSTVTDGSRQEGIIIAGYAGGTNAENIKGSAIVRGHGDETNAASGGVSANNTVGLKLDVMCFECAPNSVILSGPNVGFKLDVVSFDPWSNTVGVGRADHIYINATDNAGLIAPPMFGTNSKSATYVATEGVKVDNSSGNVVQFGSYNTAATPLQDAGNKTQFVLPGKKFAMFNHAVSGQLTLAAVATDAATTLALANSIRTALLAYGITA